MYVKKIPHIKPPPHFSLPYLPPFPLSRSLPAFLTRVRSLPRRNTRWPATKHFQINQRKLRRSQSQGTSLRNYHLVGKKKSISPGSAESRSELEKDAFVFVFACVCVSLDSLTLFLYVALFRTYAHATVHNNAHDTTHARTLTHAHTPLSFVFAPCSQFDAQRGGNKLRQNEILSDTLKRGG